MEQIDLKQLIEQYPEVLTDGTKLKAYILDLYPQCKRGMVNILVAIQQCGIVAEMQASKNPSALDMSRWKKVLDDDYGFAGATAETCLQLWCIAVGIQLEVRAKTTQKTNIVCPEAEKENGRSKQTSVSSDLQNSQKDWFEYYNLGQIQLKEKYKYYKGKIYIPDNVVWIAPGAFFGCRNLTSISVSDSVKVFCDSAFEGCSNLTSITIPEGVTRIGIWGFRNCINLRSITIPNSMRNIAPSAFEGCERLKEIWYTGKVGDWNNIKKENGGDSCTASFTVHCTDGDIPKNES